MCCHGTKYLFPISQKQSSPGKTIYPNPLLKVPLIFFFPLPSETSKSSLAKRNPSSYSSLIWTCSSPIRMSWSPCLFDSKWKGMKCKVQRSETRSAGNRRRRPPSAVKKRRAAPGERFPRAPRKRHLFSFSTFPASVHIITLAVSARGRTGVRTKALCYMLINKVIKGHLHWRARSFSIGIQPLFWEHIKAQRDDVVPSDAAPLEMRAICLLTWLCSVLHSSILRC